jgi:hypothetical protein
MPSTLNKDEISMDDPNPTKCSTCPDSLALADHLDLQDHDLPGETGATPVNAHLETGTDGKRRLVLSKA